MNQRLEMNFMTSAGSTARISLPNPNPEMVAADVKASMDAVIAEGAMAPGGYDLVSADSARIVTTQITDLEIEA